MAKVGAFRLVKWEGCMIDYDVDDDDGSRPVLEGAMLHENLHSTRPYGDGLGRYAPVWG